MLPEKTLKISHLESGGLITNYFCTSSCRHCLYRSGPRWPKDFIHQDTARKNLQAIHSLGCRAVHLGGGEPLLKPEGVAAVLDSAQKEGVAIEYIETNSSWFKDLDHACALLESLAGKGLTTLLVSISPFHNEYIPFFKVKGVIEACKKTDIKVFPWLMDFWPDVALLDDKTTHALAEYESIFGTNYLAGLEERYWISPGGRALETFSACRETRTITEITEESATGCPELADVSHFHLDLYDNYIPGLCAGLAIHRDDLGYDLSQKKYPIISALYRGGPAALMSFASRYFDFTPLKKFYRSKCELCYEIRRFLVVNKKQISIELQPSFHYFS